MADKRAIARMAAKSIVRGLVMINTSKVTECDPCIEGKMSNGSMPPQVEATEHSGGGGAHGRVHHANGVSWRRKILR